MVEVVEVVKAADALKDKDQDALALLLGMREKAIKEKPKLAEDPYFIPTYAEHMGLIDDVKALGWSIAVRWGKELHGMVCGAQDKDKADRTKILEALNLGETAVIGAVAAALMAMMVPAPIAAAAAPLIVKRFIWPARDELCAAWGEALKV